MSVSCSITGVRVGEPVYRAGSKSAAIELRGGPTRGQNLSGLAVSSDDLSMRFPANKIAHIRLTAPDRNGAEAFAAQVTQSQVPIAPGNSSQRRLSFQPDQMIRGMSMIRIT